MRNKKYLWTILIVALTAMLIIGSSVYAYEKRDGKKTLVYGERQPAPILIQANSMIGPPECFSRLFMMPC